MDDKQLIEYLLKKDAARYEFDREREKTIRHTIIIFILSVLAGICFYMYYVVPVEETKATVDGNSKAVIDTVIKGENTIWQ